MILKTSQLNSLVLLFLFPFQIFAQGFNSFECLRDIMQATDRGNFQKRRKGVERPFMLNDRYMVFPEIAGRSVTGFYLYDRSRAWYYDAVQTTLNGRPQTLAIAALAELKKNELYQMVAQPSGLETVAIHYMPGFDSKESNTSGPIMLGTSVLPVVGAFVSRPDKYDEVYQNPQAVAESRLTEWVGKKSSGRKPATSATKLERRIVHLVTRQEKAEAALWQPLKDELRLRRDWIKNNNLDDLTFKEISKPMDTSCKDEG